MKKTFHLVLGLILVSGCGVKGDPLPPETPPELGRGKPTYKKALERYDIRTEDLEDEKDDQDRQGDGQ